MYLNLYSAKYDKINEKNAVVDLDMFLHLHSINI